MRFDDYRKFALTTANKDLPEPVRALAAALGLVDEVIELTEVVSRCLDGQVDIEDGRECICGEAGDVAWYTAELGNALGLYLTEPPSGLGHNATGLTILELCLALLVAAKNIGEAVKKRYAHEHPFPRGEVGIADDINSLLLLLAKVCADCGLTFDYVLVYNQRKLSARHPDGFNPLANRAA
jgi:NTP pyrophosphatase (non-canonical NTP hydrolase)